MGVLALRRGLWAVKVSWYRVVEGGRAGARAYTPLSYIVLTTTTICCAVALKSNNLVGQAKGIPVHPRRG